MPVIQRRGMRALQIWCQRATADYSNVDVTDLTSSFKNGLAFCAIIHKYRPDLIDYSKLNPDDVFANNEMAFRVAEEHLDIPSLLDPQDMVDQDEPDKFSVVTYVSQFYHRFKDEDASKSNNSSPVVTSLTRSSESENDSLIQSSAESTPTGTPTSGGTPTTAKRPNNRIVFNQAELIAKYGEEIFSVEGKKPNGINSLCDDLEDKARVSSQEERRKN